MRCQIIYWSAVMESKGFLTVIILLFLSNGLHCSKLLPRCHWRTPVYLQCINAGLKSIPKDIPISTMYIDLSGNPHLEFQEDFFLRFHSLQMLDLSTCALKRAILLPRSLKQIRIKDNLFDEKAIRETFKNVSSSLYYIDITNNKLILEHVLRFLPKTVAVLKVEGNTMPVIRNNYFREFTKLIYLNADNCKTEEIEENSFDTLVEMTELSLGFNNLRRIPDKLFLFLKKLRKLYLNHNNLSKAPVIKGPTVMQSVYLHKNKIEILTPKDFFKLHIGYLILSDNRIRSFNLSNTKYLVIDLAYNRIKRLEAFAFKGQKSMNDIMLQNNSFSYISPLAFRGLLQVNYIHLQRNNISSLPKGIFKNMVINNLFLYGNNISSMDGVLDGMISPPKRLLLFANPHLQRITVWEYRKMSNLSNIYISCGNIKQIVSHGDLKANINCFPSVYYSIYDRDKSLERDGYNCTFELKKQAYHCIPCPQGYFTDLKVRNGYCMKCPAGSFYQDELALTYCKLCPAGQYVPPNRAPGKSPLDCLTCPDGTEKKLSAGYRACKCLDGFARTDRFGKCTKCNQLGIECRKDYPVLRKGYWWIWDSESPSNITCRNSVIDFVKNLEIENDGYNRDSVKYTCALPQPHRCPVKASCLGGINATCLNNYTGVLCSVCERGYSRQFQKCIKCPKPVYAILQFIGYLTLFIFICLLVSWTDRIVVKFDDDYTRTFADIILSNLKILLGFYQVLVVVINAFSHVNWPHSLEKTISMFQFVQLEVFRVPSLRCIKPEWGLNAIHEFWIALIGTAVFTIIILAYLAIKIAYLYFAVSLRHEFIQRSKACKNNCLRVLALFFFITYPLTSQRIVQVLPISCNNICTSMERGQCLHTLSYMKSDYSVKCLSFSGSSRLTLGFAYFAIIIPIGLPILLFCLLIKFIPDSKKQENMNIQDEGAELLLINTSNRSEENSLQFALKFLYENYDSSNRYWEPFEMLRKLVMTAGVTLFIGYYKMGIGTTILIAGLFATAHAYRRPMKDSFENIMQLVSLSIIPINLCFGVILKSDSISDDVEFRPKDDNTAIGYVLVALNLFVLLLVIIRLVHTLVKVSGTLCTALSNCFHRFCGCVFKARQAENQRVLLLD